MSEPTQLPGKFVWFELVTPDPRKAQAFYGEVLGWSIRPHQGPGGTVDMIHVGNTVIGSVRAPAGDREPARWISCLSVADIDAATRAARSAGATVRDARADLPDIGRRARITDPQGAELYLFSNRRGDPPDVDTTPHGHWLWNELHTSDPVAALAFYDKAFGITSRAMDMGAGGTYHVLSHDGTDRAGASGHLDPGAPPHWLPYVSVDDADAAIARTRQHGGSVLFGPEDIPGIGRFGVIQDPTGAILAVMKPAPMETQTN